ncbi:histidinol-phosphate transaminase [Archaeoglobus neptunius]|uniref:histidinol-phosphate transaminase n=1 Tax=Archaeoglobus neptunius TaxID=2798580 RepID=UPI0019280DD3|nr:histidinol-phosphate transaminase [Archaeoglobus neptunius]
MREVVRFINKYDPGKFPEDFSYPDVIQMGSNENPYGPSEAVRKAYMESLDMIARYPKADYHELKEAISSYIKFPVECIAVGCGASELIQAVCNIIIEELDRVVIPMPSYTLYAIYAMLRSASISFPVFERYDIDADRIAEENPKLVFLCSPNNPTGNCINEKVIRGVIESSEYVVLDEAYTEFSGESHVELVKDYENLIVLRSFSKYFGLAGMRIGYAVCSTDLADAIEKVRLPFAISYPAAKTAIAAINSRDYYETVRMKIVSERDRLYHELKKIEWLKPYPSEANFILVKVEGEKDIVERLGEKGIIVRDAGIMGLDGTHIRITVGRKEENNRLLKVLRELE